MPRIMVILSLYVLYTKTKGPSAVQLRKFFFQYYQDQDGRTLDLREEFGYRNVLHLFQILRWELRKENKK